MSGGIYLIGEDGQLVEMREARYDSEDLLQGLLAPNTQTSSPETRWTPPAPEGDCSSPGSVVCPPRRAEAPDGPSITCFSTRTRCRR